MQISHWKSPWGQGHMFWKRSLATGSFSGSQPELFEKQFCLSSERVPCLTEAVMLQWRGSWCWRSHWALSRGICSLWSMEDLFGGGRWKAAGNGGALFFKIPAGEDIFIDTSMLRWFSIYLFFCWLKTAPKMCDVEGRIMEVSFLVLLSSCLKRSVDEHGSTGIIVDSVHALGFSTTTGSWKWRGWNNFYDIRYDFSGQVTIT